MKPVHLQHFVGDYEELGVRIAERYGDYYLSLIKRGRTGAASFTVGFDMLNVIRGISETLNIDNYVLMDILGRELPPLSPSKVMAYGSRYLYAEYPRELELILFYGELEDDPFIGLSIENQLPGCLMGIGKGGVGYARTIPKRFRPEDYSLFFLHDLYPNQAETADSVLRANKIDAHVLSSYADYRSANTKSSPLPYVDTVAHLSERFHDRDETDQYAGFVLDTRSLQITILQKDTPDLTIDMMQAVNS